MIVAIDPIVMPVVRFLCAENVRTSSAVEVFNVVFPIECGNVGPSQRATAVITEESQPLEVVSLA